MVLYDLYGCEYQMSERKLDQKKRSVDYDSNRVNLLIELIFRKDTVVSELINGDFGFCLCYFLCLLKCFDTFLNKLFSFSTILP